MNLQENINRIKEVMGINESYDLFFKRRESQFLEHLIYAFEWLDPKRFNSFTEFVYSILDHAILTFFNSSGNWKLEPEERKKALPLALQILRSNVDLFDRIKDEYNQNFWATDEDFWGINESRELDFFKRRKDQIYEFIVSEFGSTLPSFYDSFEDYLSDIVNSTIDQFYFKSDRSWNPSGENVGQLREFITRLIYNDRPLFNEMKSFYYDNNPNISEEEMMNEQNTSAFVKRRLPDLIDGVLQAAKWYSPRMMPDFDTFIYRAIYSGIISVIPDDYLDSNIEEIRELEETLQKTFLTDKNLFNQIKAIYDEGMM
jgi:hypothetical protein